jgi:hypothetical protein
VTAPLIVNSHFFSDLRKWRELGDDSLVSITLKLAEGATDLPRETKRAESGRSTTQQKPGIDLQRENTFDFSHSIARFHGVSRFD